MAEALERGVEFHRAGQLDQALAWYQAALAHGSGRCPGQQPDRTGTRACRSAGEGTPYLRRAVELEPGQAAIPLQPRPGAARGGCVRAGAGGARGRAGPRARKRPRLGAGRGRRAAAGATTTGRPRLGRAPAKLDPTAIRPALKLAGLHNSRRPFRCCARSPESDRRAGGRGRAIYALWCEALAGLRDWGALRGTAASWAGGRPASPAAWRNVARAEFELGRHRAAVEAFGKAMATGDAQRGGPCRLRRAVPARIGLSGRGSGIEAGRDDGAEQRRKRWPTWHCSRCIAAVSPNPRRIAGERSAVDPEHVAAYSVLSRLRRGALADTELAIV